MAPELAERASKSLARFVSRDNRVRRATSPSSLQTTPIKQVDKRDVSNLTAPRGTYDILPAQSVRWQALEGIIDASCARFGSGEIRTPVFESTDVFVRTIGEGTDIVDKEMYTFDDRAGRSLTLRPELTAPVVRAVLEH